MAEIIWKGGWSSALGVSDMTYYKNDVVSYNNITYIVTATSIAVGSPNPTQDMAKWNTFVSGALGTSGTSGIAGTSGTSGISPIGDLRLFTAGTAGTSWTFTHNLGTPRPIVQVWGTSGQVIVPSEITSLSNTQIRIDFPEAVAGTATIGNGYSGTSGTSGTSGISPIGSAQVFTAGTAGTSWTFTHNLATPRPIVQVWNTSGAVIIPSQIRSINDNTVTIDFPVAVAGTATIGNGFSGTSGTSGTRGTSGTSGTTGTSGTSGFGVPTGGTSGQILVKNSSTSGDASWVDRTTFGKATMTLGTIVTVLSTQTQTVMEFTIPSAGVWEVNYNVRSKTTAVNSYASIYLTDTANVFVPGSSVLLSAYIQGASGQRQATNGAGTPLDVWVNNVPLGISDLQLNTRGMDFITTTGATTYRLRMSAYNGTVIASSDSFGYTLVWFKKIA